jgi:hypothetical protein
MHLPEPSIKLATHTVLWEDGPQPRHLHVPIVLKSGILNLLEPSGPVMGLLWLCIMASIMLFMAVCVSNGFHVSGQFPPGGNAWNLPARFDENLFKNPKLNKIGQKMVCYTKIKQNVSLYLATLNCHNTVTYEWDCIRPLGWQRRHKHYVNASHFDIVCLYVKGNRDLCLHRLILKNWAAIYSSCLFICNCNLKLLLTLRLPNLFLNFSTPCM